MATYEIAAFTWLGAALLAVCAIPQAWRAWRHPASARGLSWAFLLSWGFGELAMFAGMLPIASPHVLANYVLNVVLISYMIGVKATLPPALGGES